MIDVVRSFFLILQGEIGLGKAAALGKGGHGRGEVSSHIAEGWNGICVISSLI